MISYAMAALVAVTIVLDPHHGHRAAHSSLTMPVAIVNALSKSYRTIAPAPRWSPWPAMWPDWSQAPISSSARGGHNIYPHPLRLL